MAPRKETRKSKLVESSESEPETNGNGDIDFSDDSEKAESEAESEDSEPNFLQSSEDDAESEMSVEDEPESEIVQKKQKKSSSKRESKKSVSDEDSTSPVISRKKPKQDKLLSQRITISDSDDEKVQKSSKPKKKPVTVNGESKKSKATEKKQVLFTSDEEEQDWANSEEEDQTSVEKPQKKAEERKTKENDEPAEISANEEPEKQDSKKTNKKETSEILISSDSDPEPVPKSKTKVKPRKRKHVSSDEENDDKADEDDEEEKPKQKKKKRKRKTDSDKENEEAEKAKKKKEKTKSQKIMTDDKLSESTKQAEQDEKERKARLEKLREERKNTSKEQGFANAEWNGILNKEPLIEVDPDLCNKLKSHQVEGIQFMWDCVIESVTKTGKNEYKLGSNAKGHGAILAHCMGLGKTLQGITIAHTIITHEFLKLTRFVVLCPLNVCENWQIECDKWTENLGQPLSSWNLHTTTDPAERLEMTKEWNEQGGLLIMGYTMWRNLTTGKNVTKKTKRYIPKFKELLLENSDVIICDEGHLLKNSESALSKSVRQIKTLRRIVLTGTPMQNNLGMYYGHNYASIFNNPISDEYHCMVDFVRPNLLGTSKEFRNRFANPIRNGESIDASPFDVKLMKKRAFILSKQLDGVVQDRL